MMDIEKTALVVCSSLTVLSLVVGFYGGAVAFGVVSVIAGIDVVSR